MTISQLGQINPTGLIVPGLYVQIVPPQNLLLNGVPTNMLGAIGTATWGPVNSPTPISRMSDYAAAFGPIQPRKYDLGTGCALAVLQGASNIKAVRVTDGTDLAASLAISALDTVKQVTIGGSKTTADVITLNVTPNGGSLVALAYTAQAGDTLQTIAVALQGLVNANATLQAAGIVADTPSAGVFNLHYPAGQVPTGSGSSSGAATETVTVGNAGTLSTVQRTYASKWTGSLGNSISVVEAAGSAANSTKVTISIPGRVPEIFDNIPGAGAVLIANLSKAINLGQSGARGPSQIVTLTAGFGSAAPPVPTTYTLAGGTDGATTITGATLLGVDTVPRSGLYALRNQGCSVGMLVDVDDSTTWAAQAAFGIAEGVYMIAAGPAGDTIANAVTTKAGASVDTYGLKVLFGDWIYWLDQVNGLTRLVSPQGVIAGILSNLSPQNSTLNKQVFGVVGTQKSATGATYSNAELQTLVQAGIDVVGVPSWAPSAGYLCALVGHNASSNPVVQGDNYTRMTNYIAATLNAGMGRYLGQLQNPTTQKNAKATLDAFFSTLERQGLIGTSDGLTVPWQVKLDPSNNSQPRVALGFMQADIQVTYLSVVEKLLLNVEGGQSVTVQRLSTLPNI